MMDIGGIKKRQITQPRSYDIKMSDIEKEMNRQMSDGIADIFRYRKKHNHEKGGIFTNCPACRRIFGITET
jgi:hypothetical protein